MPLQVIVPSKEFFNEETNKFYPMKETKLVLEHSLLSIHKWEQKWKKPFLKEGVLQETGEEGILDYIRCMTINKDVDPLVYMSLTNEIVRQITEYINDPMTATWFSDEKNTPKRNGRPIMKRNKEILTAEVIYWQMITLQIPIEFEKWHLNSLLTLIKVCGIKNEEQHNELNGKKGKPKMPNLKSRAALNAKRRAATGSKG